jgi:hypothetical protein
MNAIFVLRNSDFSKFLLLGFLKLFRQCGLFEFTFYYITIKDLF